MFKWFKKLWKKITGKKERTEAEEYRETRRDNIPSLPLPALPDSDGNESEDEMLIWYPERVKHPYIDSLKMKTRGYYTKGHPEGAVIHFTAGRSRKKSEGGSRNAETHLDQGVRGVKNAVAQGSYAYFVIDRDGNVFQQFPLNRWGYHAGKSKCPETGRPSVSTHYVGIEMQNAGKLKKVDNERFMAWFSKPEKGDEYFYKSKGEVKHFQKNENIASGHYHLYSLEQKKALVDLLLWLENNGNGIFNIDKVFGHDEVAGPAGLGYWRKTDPGGALDMTMKEFRQMLKDIKEAEARMIK
jgi:hypothetical protein